MRSASAHAVRITRVLWRLWHRHNNVSVVGFWTGWWCLLLGPCLGFCAEAVQTVQCSLDSGVSLSRRFRGARNKIITFSSRKKIVSLFFLSFFLVCGLIVRAVSHSWNSQVLTVLQKRRKKIRQNIAGWRRRREGARLDQPACVIPLCFCWCCLQLETAGCSRGRTGGARCSTCRGWAGRSAAGANGWARPGRRRTSPTPRSSGGWSSMGERRIAYLAKVEVQSFPSIFLAINFISLL